MNSPNPAPDLRPHFVDNRNGLTLDKALREHLRVLRERQQFVFSLDVATAFFNVPGFDLLADEFCRTAKVRLLLSAEPKPEAERVLPQPGDPPEPQFTARLVAEGLSKLNDSLARSRDLLPFDEESDAAVRCLLDVLHSGRVEVKRYTKRFLHAKAFLFRTPGGGLVTGSSNLTYAGLRKNLELNLGHFDVPAVPRVEVWFDELWENAEPFDLAAIYDRLMAEFPPYLIYLRVLFALYGEELAEEEQEMGDIPLTTFQQHGVWRALRILKRCEEPHLHSALEDYALVVIDESHAYRNPDSPARAGVLRQLLLGPRRDLLLLTATPVNNSLWDLYHLLRYFVKQDAFFADRGVLSMRERFQDAMRVDPFNLNPDMLYPVIDATTVKRTRQFIKRHYANDLVMLPDGSRVPVEFPKPLASSITYDLETILPGFMAELEIALDPPDGSLPLLTLARYQPENYPARQPPSTLDTAIVGLIRSGLLKRFESSVHAFARTSQKMAREHELFLKALGQGIVLRKTFFQELSAAEGDDELIDELIESGDHTDPASAYDVATLRRDAESDRKLLAAMHQRTARVKDNEDTKLAVLVKELVKVVEQAREDSATPEVERRSRKVLVFSFYEDTVNWIEGFLDRVIERDKRLSCYRGRMASVAGNEVRHGVSRRDAVWGFAPESSGAPRGWEDKFDLLVCTDVLAEGLNLQQCCNVINFDLPWNPMRLVQRHGRIDRIGSPHKRVFLRTYFPDAQLDALLKLEARVRRKLAQAAASVGVEVTPIERGSEGQQSFTETREEIERLRQNDASIYERGGTVSSAQTGEEYRQELRKALMKRGDEIRLLPWKAGSGMSKGNRRGHLFCATVGKRVYLRFVPFDGGQLVSEIGTCLRMIECVEDAPMVMPQDLKHTAFSAWQKARQDIFASWTYETDPANLQPRVPALNRAVAEHIRQYPSPGIDQQRLARSLEAVEAPCSVREQKLLRTVFEQDFPSADAKSLALITEIERIGLEPFHAPEPLPPIQPEDVHLICWMALESN